MSNTVLGATYRSNSLATSLVKNNPNLSKDSFFSYFRLYFLLKLYNLYFLKSKSSFKKEHYLFFCSIFSKVIKSNDDYLNLFFRLLYKYSPSYMYPSLRYDRFMSSWTFQGKKGKFSTVWFKFSTFLLGTFGVSPLFYIHFMLMQFWFPFMLIPSRKGRKVFRIPRNMHSRRAFRVMTHRLKLTVKGQKNLSFLHKWYYYLLDFLRPFRMRRIYYYFLDDTLTTTKLFMSYRKPLPKFSKKPSIK